MDVRRARAVVVGGGQSGLSAAWHLIRAGLRPRHDLIVLDDADRPGGAWPRTWPSLRIFSPAEYSSLPGTPMPCPGGDGVPGRDHVTTYLTDYEQRYSLAVERPVRVLGVERPDDPSAPVRLRTTRGAIDTDHLVNATGTWASPFVPTWRGASGFPGAMVHSAGYRGPEPYAGSRVLVVGGGNSAAQIVAELSETAETRWVTRRPPRFLPADVDGRVLFQIATARRRQREAAAASGARSVPPGSIPPSSSGRGPWSPAPDPAEPALTERALGDIVQIEPVARARAEGRLVAHRPFVGFDGADAVWDEGTRWRADTVIWATGFRPALRHLRGTGLLAPDRTAAVDGIRSRVDPRVWFVGYGDWTGSASATLIGVGRTGRQLATALG